MVPTCPPFKSKWKRPMYDLWLFNQCSDNNGVSGSGLDFGCDGFGCWGCCGCVCCFGSLLVSGAVWVIIGATAALDSGFATAVFSCCGLVSEVVSIKSMATTSFKIFSKSWMSCVIFWIFLGVSSAVFAATCCLSNSIIFNLSFIQAPAFI